MDNIQKQLIEWPDQNSSTLITLVFTDMVGSSAAKRAGLQGGDATVRDSAFIDAVQSRHLHVVRECLAAHNGKEIMTIGDAFFLTFDSPQDALFCCAEIQMRLKTSPIMTASGPLKLRIGIHFGAPKFFENSWHGTDVDIASRAESAGSGEQIVLTDAAKRQLGELPGIPLRPLGTFALKGVGDIKLWDADYDQHGPRKPEILSLEQVRRNRRIQLLERIGYGVLAACLVVGGFFIYKHRQGNHITEKDKLILADFDNKTGDPVFDSTLKEALSIQLEQSPYLQLVGDQELHADLRYLNQPTEQRITPELAREIGQREGIKAYISASVASLGGSYVVSVDAISCATGDPIARAQAVVTNKNQVLTAVSTAATTLRTKLGESLASVQKLTTPFMDVTTSSLEAFHAYSLGEDAHRRSADPEAMVFYKQAIDLDPNFAMAYARLGVVYRNSGQASKGLTALNKAYELRQHATERERLYIAAQYASARGDIPEAISAYQSLLAAYPRDPAGLNNMAIMYTASGDNVKAASYFRQVTDSAKWDVAADDNLAGSLLTLDNPTDAKKYNDSSAAVSNGTDTPLLGNQAIYAFETGDSSWKRSALAENSRPDGFLLDAALSNMNYMQGSLAEGRASAEHGARYAAEVKAPDAAGNLLATAALFEAQYGDCSQVTAIARKALSYDASSQTLPGVTDALAMCGAGTAELSALRKMANASPDNTLLNLVYLPEAEAAQALAQHRPQSVAELLESTHPYALASVAPIIEAEALLALHRPTDAVNMLQPALKYRYNETSAGPNGQAPSYGMATLLAARAQAVAGDKSAATESYQRAIELWKNADAGFKPLEEAKRELAALK
jgi:class 3 adenylate cyclase/tetratricopeptide (TPR) repeat protein